MWCFQAFTREWTIAIRSGQVGLTFATGCICIALFTSLSGVEGSMLFCFSVSLCTMLVLMYEGIAPYLTSRTRCVPSPYMYAILDSATTVLWTLAYIFLLVWISRGGCSHSGRDSARNCALGEGVVVFSMLMSVLCGIISYLSITQALRSRGRSDGPSLELRDKTSSRPMLPDRPRLSQRIPSADDTRRFTLMPSTETADGRHPGRKISFGGLKHIRIPTVDLNRTKSALSPPEDDVRQSKLFSSRTYMER